MRKDACIGEALDTLHSMTEWFTCRRLAALTMLKTRCRSVVTEARALRLESRRSFAQVLLLLSGELEPRVVSAAVPVPRGRSIIPRCFRLEARNCTGPEYWKGRSG